MKLDITQDLWSRLCGDSRPVVIYGMGNGADKVIDVCTAHGIEVADFYASDAFVRGQSFHGKTVMTYDQVRSKYGDGNFITLMSFATRLDEVISNVCRIASENELYAPDVPVFGNDLFDMRFFKKYEDDMDYVYDILADDVSRQAYRDIISYKLTGKIDYLLNCEHPREQIFTSLLTPASYRVFADLGAYTGDTIRELLQYAPSLKYVFAFEPDLKTYKKLSRYAENETACNIAALNLAAWSEKAELTFDCSGNRNSNIGNGTRTVQIEADSLDNILMGHAADYIKYDVEGSEMQALFGSAETIRRFSPQLCVSLYHRSEDIFLLPMLVEHLNPGYKMYIRRGRYIPAWDINLIAVKK